MSNLKTAAIRVLDAGMLTTVQDLGRVGLGAIGVARGGAADALSLRTGNRLVGNRDNDAALEMTLLGGAYLFKHDAVIAICGGDCVARIENARGIRVAHDWTPLSISADERLIVGPIQTGARCYLCVAGGIDAPLVLGSRSTHLRAGFGGIDGRKLSANDLLEIGPTRAGSRNEFTSQRLASFCREHLARRALRAVDGAHADSYDDMTLETFWSSSYEVSNQSDRSGLRLVGKLGSTPHGGRMPSEGMMHGAVQTPPGGEPIILMADYPTTGGYPVIACVAAVDLPVLGQLRPRDTITFERVTLHDARTVYADFERRLNEIAPPISDDHS